ncbi:Methyltransferase domain containing protein [Novymonas esmeraldas]|uniref:Methyltransferase domain containing protein n=1 Tax=Novymonas esmeraldas TaxID=1808958 RepID=A0AAW0EMY3_9TRYP
MEVGQRGCADWALAHPCRLCTSTQVSHFHRDKKREYLVCAACGLVFVPDRFFLSSADEKALYDLHENVPGDTRYQQFLSRATVPLTEYLATTQSAASPGCVRRGLDFGCGPAPVLASMLAAEPHNCSMDVYDLFYFPDSKECLAREGYYDFITATEVVEHLQDPLSVLRQLWSCLRQDGGALVIMTKRVDGAIERFRNWHYIRDPTHITFFHERSFAWLAQALPSTSGEHCEVRFVAADVVLLIKTTRP